MEREVMLRSASVDNSKQSLGTMPCSRLVSVDPAGCGVASIFRARWREPYRESEAVHRKRASSPSKKMSCRVRSALDACEAK